ncbi:hypothetical protein MPTK1_3g18230 [Marchantia polymorpha subsp. ruderalis]|uniref:Uncharacterized protein n=2 Tax=Marchantia polymorpha TaxID=3197 RepID=A0AAF6B250_MARPO|nr:hypothetical protein MARPO_0140s0018 [Marchantia polymorpha]BBN06084.1 hypothetical protein Mp_3g18230 [Marchantia polymorpha subsp. ruderalis]|eukprot:PTQ29483.1 hypothetical protein MARPO_0140s0018 [Marchantia polymorpha]
MVYVWSSSRAAAGAAALMGSGSIGRVGTGSRKQVVQVLLSLVALAFCFAQVSDAHDYTPTTFLRAQLAGAGRSPWLSCQTNATICKDKTKNPYGGETCCGKRICRDLQYDEMNCGLCNRYCAYGLSCCSGKCVNINGDDNKNCGRCGNVCPKKYKCTFGMCGYADDEDQGEEDRKK